MNNVVVVVVISFVKDGSVNNLILNLKHIVVDKRSRMSEFSSMDDFEFGNPRADLLF